MGTKTRTKVPDAFADALLYANRHTCCICHEARKHVQIHHIDGNPASHDARDVAVLCVDCHSRVTGNEGLGRRFTPGEVRRYKRAWEAQCAEVVADNSEPEEPLAVFRRCVLVRAGEHWPRDFPMERGDMLVATISADDYIGISICSRPDFRRWLSTGELNEYDGEAETRECELDFVAPRKAVYTLVAINEGRDALEVTVDVTVWEGGNE